MPKELTPEAQDKIDDIERRLARGERINQKERAVYGDLGGRPKKEQQLALLGKEEDWTITEVGALCTPKQIEFVNAYLSEAHYGNARSAYMAVFSCDPAYAANRASSMINKPHVQAYLTLRMKEVSEKAQISAEYVLSKLKNIVEDSMDVKEVKDKEGNPTGETKLKDSTAALRALEMLGKYHKLFTDKVEMKTEHSIGDLMAEVSNSDSGSPMKILNNKKESALPPPVATQEKSDVESD